MRMFVTHVEGRIYEANDGTRFKLVRNKLQRQSDGLVFAAIRFDNDSFIAKLY